MLAIFSCFSAKLHEGRECLENNSDSSGSNQPKNIPTLRTQEHRACGGASNGFDDTAEWELIDLEEEDAQKHKSSGEAPSQADFNLTSLADSACTEPLGRGDNGESKFVTKIFHYNAEDWKHFQTTLDQEYKDQHQEPFSKAPTVDLRQPSSTSGHTDETNAENDPDTSRELTWIDDDCNRNASNATTLDLEKQDTIDYIRELVSRLVYRVEKKVLLKQLREEAGDQESIRSDDKARAKRQAHPAMSTDGRGGDNVKRNIAWTVHITPPNTAWSILDPDISDAFQKEYSKILTHKDQEKKRKAELVAPSCRPVNSPAPGPISHGCRIPVPVMGTPRGLRIALPAKENVNPIYQQRSKGCLDLDPVTKREMEFFKRTLLFRERVRMNKAWKRGLTPLQIWVVKNHSDDIQEEPPHPSPTKKKTRTEPIKCKISCWRK